MNTLTESTNGVQTATQATRPSKWAKAPSTAAPTRPHWNPFDVVRDVQFPTSESIYDCVLAIEDCYRRMTGLTIETKTALRLLDRIIKDRETLDDPLNPRPLPVRLSPVADWLMRNGYNRDACYLAIRAIERDGSARITGVIDGEDVEFVQEILDRINAEAN